MITFDDSKEARAKMICGHVISTESMTQFLRSLVSNRQYRIVCPSFKQDNSRCCTEWEYNLCRRVGVLTREENDEFERGFEQNMFSELLGGKECPFCMSFIIKPHSVKSNRVKCVICSQKKPVDFCWKCMGIWRTNGFDKCGNLDCMGKNEA